MNKLNVLTIDRSQEICEMLKKLLEENSTVGEVRTTTDSKKGIQLLKHVAVDMVILDVMSPDVDGESAIKAILNQHVIPIIVISEPSVDQTAKTVTAMSHGAIDFIKKVNFKDSEQLAQFEIDLVMKMHNVNNANRLRSIARKVKETPLLETTDVEKQSVQIVEPVPPAPYDNKNVIVVIGTSTGGPRALHQVIQQLPKDFNHPILIVQHMPAGFTKSLAERLNQIGNIHVKEAVQGETIQKGTAYIAPGDFHMLTKRFRDGLKVELSKEPAHLPHRPSVDLLFQSVAQLHDFHKISVVLTGMGKDGAIGVTEIKAYEEDAVILSESKETSVIYGMPRAVLETNLVTQVLRIEKIGSAIVAYTQKRGN